MSAAHASLQARLGYVFREPTLLTRALTHPSYLQDHPEAAENNQRLEFLGDSVLQLVMSDALFQLYPADREGALSKRRAALTNGPFLARLAREIGLDAALLLSTSEEQTGGRARASSLEDAFEALVGALYLDGGLAETQRVLLAIYGPLGERLSGAQAGENPKGRLQERVQPDHGNQALRYEVTHVSGEDHAREYEAHVFLHDTFLGNGRGSSKKLAEEAAAKAALLALAARDSAT